MKKTWKWGVVSAGIVLLSPIVYEFIYIQFRFHRIDEAAATASRFLAALNVHDYANAHAMLADSQQQVTSIKVIQKAEEQVEKKHGKPIGKPERDESHPNDALDHVTFFYDVSFNSSDDMYIMVHTILTPGGWRILEYHYDSGPA